MANTSAVYVHIDANLKESAEAIPARLGMPPASLIQMTRDQLDAELAKGMESFHAGSFTADEIDRALARE